MLKQRVIATLIIKNNIVVQSIGFKKYLPVGRLDIAVEYLNRWGIDEIIILDIDASRNQTLISTDLIQKASQSCFVPICVGGGIKSIKDIQNLLSNGADKVSINHHFLHAPSFIKEAVSTFGSQCIVITFDVQKINGQYLIYDYLNDTIFESLEHGLKLAQAYNVGEILINNVDRDGMKTGLDSELANIVTSFSSLPIMMLGGAKNPQDLLDGIKNPKLSAVCAANFFHFTEHSVNIAKSFIKKEVNYPIRHESHVQYKEFSFDTDGRILKRDDRELSQLLFEVQEEEII